MIYFAHGAVTHAPQSRAPRTRTEIVNPINTECRLCGTATNGGGVLCRSCVVLPG
jgi:hypothetical protein